MNIPAFAIRRSVTIYMSCAVAILLGGISFERLPVDLMPDNRIPAHLGQHHLSGRGAGRDRAVDLPPH